MHRIMFFIGLLLATFALGHSSVDENIPNTPVLDQTGHSVMFYDDLVKDKIVAINFVFTRCGMVCPMLGFRFGQLRKLLNNEGHDQNQVHLISISTDASYDTPARMQTWAQQFYQGTGWTQVTGDKPRIDHLLKSLKAFSADKQDHSSLVLLINDQRNEWKWIDGQSDPKIIQMALSEWQKPVQNETTFNH